ncbi:MAG TPA: nucleotidyl transferase AbiEii/AbiGii toxin family protein [Gemmataceae bacterium]|nr:nucleotidyl transferase AbiEii/AbiGii toxin family protein [Gemmataceae bacterium]
MNGLFHAAWEAEQFMRQQKWRFCLIGGLAVIRWGQPRATQDVDFALLTGFGGEEAYVDRLLARFPARIKDAKDFALQHRVVLARTADGVSLDIALAGISFEEKVIDRASDFTFAEGLSLTTASAEDLLVLKAFAGRDQDWFDVRGIVARQENQLDWNYVLAELTFLSELKEDPDSLKRLETIRQEGKSRAKQP